MRYCPNCGKPAGDTDAICSACGTVLPAPNGIDQANQQNPYQQNLYQQNQYQQNPYQQNGYQQPPAYNSADMPSKGLYTALMVISFLFGCLWGLLCIAPYSNMTKAITNGDVDTAKRNARLILIFFCVGLVINVVLLLIYAGNSR